MRLIDKLVMIDLVGPFINGLLMFEMLLFAATYLFPATDLIVKGVPAATVILFVIYSLPSLMTQTFPMAMLLSSLMGIGRLSSDSEMVAVFAAGVSFARAARSLIILGSLVAVVAFFWNDLVVPPASARALAIRRDAEKHIQSNDRPIDYDIQGKNGIEEKIAVKGGFDSKTKALRNVTIVKYSDDPKRLGQPEVVIYCRRAIADDQKGLNWRYYDGYIAPFKTEDNGQLENILFINFKELRSLPRGASLGKRWDEILSVERDDPNAKSFATLRREIAADRKKGMETGGKEVDLYGKIALPLASLIFGVVGGALGNNTRRGGGKTVGFGMAIFIVFLYWIFYHSMYVAGKGGGLSPMLAGFLPDIVGAGIGVFLTIRASR